VPFDVLKLFDAASARQKQAQGRWVRLNVERATWAALRNKVHQGDFQLETSALQAMREARSDQALEAANQVRGAEAACESKRFSAVFIRSGERRAALYHRQAPPNEPQPKVLTLTRRTLTRGALTIGGRSTCWSVQLTHYTRHIYVTYVAYVTYVTYVTCVTQALNLLDGALELLEDSEISAAGGQMELLNSARESAVKAAAVREQGEQRLSESLIEHAKREGALAPLVEINRLIIAIEGRLNNAAFISTEFSVNGISMDLRKKVEQ
jgi:hypothetical protein